MNFKQCYLCSLGYLCFCLFNKKTLAMLLSFFFTYYAWMPMHMGSTKFECDSLGNYYCETVHARVRCD